MEIRLPRMRRVSRAGARSRSAPRNRTSPATRAGGLSSRPITAPTLTLFPEPDSPRMPTVSPRRIEKLTPFTARTRPCGDSNATRRFDTVRAASGFRSAIATAAPGR